MTAEELKKTGKDLYSPAEVADVLHWQSQYIRVAARENPALLPFPVLIHKRRVQIPAIGFWNWWNSMGKKERND